MTVDPHYTDSAVTLYHGDCVEVLRGLPDNSVHAIVTDPPYGLEFMGKEWDSFKQTPQAWATRNKSEDLTGKTSSPFLAAQVNSYGAGLPFQQWCTEWATECLRVLKPGGHMLAFGGSRTWHRLAVAVEDAGFEIRDSIAWLYGSGFPKNLDVGKAIDGLDAADERRRRSLSFTEWLRSTTVNAAQLNTITGSNMGNHYLTDKEQPHVPTPAHFAKIEELVTKLGHGIPEWVRDLVHDRAVESENIAAREVIGTHDTPPAGQTWMANNGFNADLSTGKPITVPLTEEARTWAGWGTALKPAFEPIVVGRKPFKGTIARNVLAHGTAALHIDAVRTETDEIRVQGSQSQPGATSMQPRPREGGKVYDKGRWPTNVVLDGSQSEALAAEAGDTARFFPTFHYEPKAPTFERPRDDENGVVHPTVKPLDLMRWLVRLVTPPGGHVLEPFGGSGTTAEACVVEGFSCTIIERDETYLPLIIRRLTKPIQVALDFGEEA